MSLLSGPEVGGSVIQITNTAYCLNPGVNTYCRFGNDQAVLGVRVDDNTIECVSPPKTDASSIEVSYSVFIPGCFYDPNEVNWNTINDNFDFDGDLTGVVIDDSSIFGDDSARLIIAGKPYRAKWNSNALLLSALANSATLSSLEIDLEVVAKFETEKLTFHKLVQTVPISPNNRNDINLVVDQQAISPAINTYENGIERVAIAHVRIVAYSITPAGRRIHAVRSTKLIGILPEDEDGRIKRAFCPVRPLDSCSQENDAPPCPPSYNISKNDFDFTEDETCTWPSGSADSCVISSDLNVDFLETCEKYQDHPAYPEYCANIDPDAEIAENCDCEYFQNGAAGCVKNGRSQCCYSTSGGLITDPNDGGGTRDCSSDSSQNFLNDILPYMYCCKLSRNPENCDAYYAARPSISDDGYITPYLPRFTFGDPHLQSFDKINFDFNGFGEYVAFCGKINGASVSNNIKNCQPSSQEVLKRRDTISVHFRFTKLDDSHNGTVTVGVAIEDPSFRKGTQALAIVTHPTKRLEVYSGSNIVRFPGGKRKNKRRSKKKVIFGASMWMTDKDSPDFNVRIRLASGLMIRIRENVGVMTVGFLRLPTINTTQHVGLLGIPDNDDTNDFTAANETILNITSYASVSERYEGIFHDFGQTWMVRNKTSSLFQRLVAEYDFYDYYNPNFVPSFAHFGNDTDDNCPQDICGNYTGFLLESCCYDYTVTNDTQIVRAMLEDAEKELEVQIVLNNTVPEITNGRNQSASVEIGQSASFVIVTRDEDGDNITAALVFNDLDPGLFKFVTISPVMFGLSFSGSQLDGIFKAQVSITDGKTPILFTASVQVIPPPCKNDRSYRYQGRKQKTCVWLEKNKSRRHRLCARKGVRDACRMTCGLCCKDDKTYRYATRSGFLRGCAWTAEKISRTTRYCTREKVKSNCPVTCGNCQKKFACINNRSFRFDNMNKSKPCAWISGQNLRRVKLCARKDVRRHCPTTCGLCCENDPAFSFTNNIGNLAGCGWIAKRASRKSKYCPLARVRASCPEETACNSCQANVPI